MSFWGSLLTYIAVKDIVKNLATKENFRWLKYYHDRYLVPKCIHFSSYKMNMQDKFEKVNSSILGNAQRNLTDVYVPQDIIPDGEHEVIKIEGFPVALARKFRYLVIKDYAGRGKSTLMKQMFIGAINEGMYPLFVELRNLNDGLSLMDELLANLNEIDCKFSEKLLRSFIKQGDFVFFFDGLDEVNANRRADVTKDIKNLIDKSRNNIFILTSRNDDALTGFGDFKGFSIRDFELEQACELILKYDNHGANSARLIEELKDGKHQEVAEFLKSPLHTALFYKVFVDKNGIPYKLHEVCDEIFKSLLNLHDLSKDGYYEHEKKCKLSGVDYLKVLGYMAFWSLKMKKHKISRLEMISLFATIREQDQTLKFADDDMTYDLVVALSLFKYKGQDLCWIHEAMCQYFATCYIRQDRNRKRSEMLRAFFGSKDLELYIPMLRMYGEIEPGEFRKYFLTALLEDMKGQYAQYLKNAKTGIRPDSFHTRCFLLYSYLIETENNEKGWCFFCKKKIHGYIVEMLYAHCNGNFHKMKEEQGIPVHDNGENGARKKLTINSFADLQQAYDFANYKSAEKMKIDYSYLAVDDISALISQLSDEYLVTDDPNLLNNI